MWLLGISTQDGYYSEALKTLGCGVIVYSLILSHLVTTSTAVVNSETVKYALI